MLGALSGLEHFKYYVCGKKVNLLTNHQAVQPLFKRNRAHKQHSARLTRVLDRTGHFDVNVQYIARKNISLRNNTSRHPIVYDDKTEVECPNNKKDVLTTGDNFVFNQIYGLF